MSEGRAHRVVDDPGCERRAEHHECVIGNSDGNFHTRILGVDHTQASNQESSQRPDHEATSVDVPITIWYLLISPSKMQPDEMMLTVGATQLGNKKAEEGQEFITKLKTRITATESSAEQSGEIKAEGKGNVSADALACKHVLK